MSNLFIPIKKAELTWRDSVPVSVQYDDVYHSSDGGVEQSVHVFINGNNLIERWQALSKKSTRVFVIGETGFGAGLNFLVSWSLWEQYAPSSCRLRFISCEKHPLSRADLTKILVSWPHLKEYSKQLLDQYPILTPGYHHLSFCEGKVTLTLMLGDALESYEQLLICGEPKLEQQLRSSFIDAWYLDGFAPAKNKSMWSDSLIKVIALLSQENTTFATYTAAGTVKRSLQGHGFILEKRNGFGTKRHMLCGYLPQLSDNHQLKRHTPWHIGKPNQYRKKSAVIIGAGLAGCFTAFSLAHRGWSVTVIDELNEVGQGGSANTQAVLFPMLSAYKAPLTQFMLMAFLYAVRVYQPFLNKYNLGVLNGALLLAHNDREKAIQESLYSWLLEYPELGRLVDCNQASELAGFSVAQSGLLIPLSGWINSPELCKYLVDTKGIDVVTNKSVTQLAFDKQWTINGFEAEVVILANGPKVNSFKETRYLPIKPIRGQMTAISATEQSAALKVPLCSEGHVLPALNGLHQVGATYELNASLSSIKKEDDVMNVARLKQFTSEILWSDAIIDHWSGVRATTPDYLPLVGPIANAKQFYDCYMRLETNAKQWIPDSGPYYPGLYVCSGFGSRGLTSIPLCAEWLASLVNDELSFLPRNLQYALSPSRFLRKNIIRGKVKID